MANTDIGMTPYSATSVTLTTSLDGLANGSVATISDITAPTTAGGNYFTEARLEINLGAATEVGQSGTPNLQAVLFGAVGTPSPPTGVSNGQLYPLNSCVTGANTIVSTSTQMLVVDRLPVPPLGTLSLSVFNNLGVAFPSSGVTATLYFTTASVG